MRELNKVKAGWWQKGDPDLHEYIWNHIGYIRRNQHKRIKDNEVYYNMYSGKVFAGIDGSTYSQRLGGGTRLNVSNNVCSSATSKIAKNKPRAEAIVDFGLWSDKHRAEQVSSALNGTFISTRAYPTMQAAFLDSTIFDCGIVKVWADHDKGRPAVERVLFNEMLVDDQESMGGNPRITHRVKRIARHIAEKMWPDKKDIIDKAGKGANKKPDDYGADMIEVAETIQLPSLPDAGDGIRAITVDRGTLEAHEYRLDYHPYIVLRWNLSPFGWFGNSLCSLIRPMQERLDVVIDKIYEHVKNHSGFIAVKEGSNVLDEHIIANEVWKLIVYDEAKPSYEYGPSVDQATLAYARELVEQIYEATGISMLTATSRKPAGLNSGVAIENYNDVESVRFQMTEQRYEQAFVDMAWMFVDAYDELYEYDKDIKVRYKDGNRLRAIDWGKVRVDKENLEIDLKPTGFLPGTASGRYQKVDRMVQSGLLDKDEALSVLDFPDLKGVLGLKVASQKVISMHIEKMLDPEEPEMVAPGMFIDHQLAVKMAVNAYNQAELDGAPEENLDLLRAYIEEIQENLKEQQKEQMKAQMEAQMEMQQKQQAQAQAQQAPEGQPTSPEAAPPQQ